MAVCVPVPVPVPVPAPIPEQWLGAPRVVAAEACEVMWTSQSRTFMRLQDDGWLLSRTRGSHKQFSHPSKPGLVTVPGKPGDELPKGTLASVLRQAGLK